MTNNKKTYRVGDPMSAGTFRMYVTHFPNAILRNAGAILQDGKATLERPTFVAVAHSLIATGDFKTGEKFRLSQVAIADISGCDRKTVARVLKLLELSGAIRVVDTSKRPGGGKPVKNYTLTFSQHVKDVTTVRDRNKNADLWKRVERGAESNVHHNPIAMSTTTPVNGDHKPSQWGPQPHNRNLQEPKQERSEVSSPALIGASPAGAPGAADREDPYGLDSLLENDPAFLALVEGL